MDASTFYAYDLTFRGVPDSLVSQHVEGSECCLIHADNPLSRTKGVWVNPYVRVAYSGSTYESVHPHGLRLSTWAVKLHLVMSINSGPRRYLANKA